LDKAQALVANDRRTLAVYDQLAKSLFLELFGDPVRNERGWEVVALRDACERIQVGPFGSQLHSYDYVDEGIPLINPMHLIDLKIVPSQSMNITNEKYDELENYHLNQGDIIMARRGEMGRCALVTAQENGWFCGTGSLFLRPSPSLIPEYLLYTLSGASAVQYLEQEAKGVTMSNLSKGILEKFRVALPPMKTQKKFQLGLAKLDAQRALSLTSVHRSEDLFGSLLQGAFKGQLG